jgi:hypothetical protein
MNGFLSTGRSPERVQQPGRSVAAGEEKRQPPLLQDFGDGENVPAGKVDVENGKIEVRVVRQRLGVFDGRSFRDDAMTKLFQHVRDHHSNERFILDQKYIHHLEAPALALGRLRVYLGGVRLGIHTWDD